MNYILTKLFAALLTLLFFLLLSDCYAQNSIGFTGGINFAKIKYEYTGTDWSIYEPNAESVIKPYLGFRIESLFGKSETMKGLFQSGLFVNFTGSKEKYPRYYSEDTLKSQIAQKYYDMGYDNVTIDCISVKGAINLIYFEVPFHFGMYYKGIRVFAGPYFRFGISGNYKREIGYDVYASQNWGGTLPVINKTDTQKDNYKVQFEASRVEKTGLEDDKIYYKIYDFGLNYGIGYQYESLFLSMHWSSGLTNIVAEVEGSVDPNYINQQNRLFNISLTILF
ncbi:MAG: hypothetical protein K8S16_17530 [Bacteroidales bacterium]|nr:hypothetical protein [Bacteroidales bacterium]